MFIEFVNRGGIQLIKDLILWLVKYLYHLEHNKRPKSLNLCKNI
jgi:hypothetical protein